MKTFFYIALLLTLLGITFASTFVGNYSNPDHPGKCVIDPDLILPPGEHINPRTCGRILCSRDGWAEFQFCSPKFIDGCTLGEYLDKSVGYPECCKQKLSCPDDPKSDGTYV